ncbi:MAG: dehydrogenase E1 component subunit alpha/beta [Bacteroidetes bacterium]|jgi:2-oxoisovalerate dehydrogenase E1 component|nr:dehydrogenase E1 component subunit alpha/beta [Bacteroidota bacterium]
MPPTKRDAKQADKTNGKSELAVELADGLPTHEQLVDAYKLMLLARRLDEKELALLKQGKAFFHIGGSGHEAVQVACAMNLKPGYDWAYPYYRGLGFAMGVGFTSEEIMLAELHRAEDVMTGGRQMPGHYGKPSLNIPTQSSPTGTQFLQAVGTALACVRDKKDQVVYVSSGEGATSEGEFSEALNWASREKLPVIFCIEDNHYAISVPEWQQTAGGSVYEIAKGYENLARYKVNGTDFRESYAAAKEAVARARKGEGPSLIVADVVRLLSHSSSDDDRKYRPKDEIEKDHARDPLLVMESLLISEQIVTQAEVESIQKETKRRVDEAADWAESRPLPDPSTVTLHLFAPAETYSHFEFEKSVPSGKRIVMVDAINHALHEEMLKNPKMLIWGEDVEDGKGGVFTATKGLSTKFGRERVFNSQLAEASIVGTAFGASVRGFKPVVEIQFADYIFPAMMQLKNEVGMMRYRSNNSWACPMVIRVPVGGYIHGGHYHSQSIESLFAHCPGLYIAYPSTSADAKGLLKTAIRMEDPVMFLEHKGLYRQSYAMSPEPDDGYLVPFGKASIRREGKDITVVTYGSMVYMALNASKKLAEQGTEVEVIDLRTIVPFDKEAVLESVKKTNKVLVLSEDTRTSGFAAEISSVIAEEAFEHLDAPIKRITARDFPIPYSPSLEPVILPTEAQITKALEELASY